MYSVDYNTFDILQDDKVRQGLKKYSNWPTYPQLYVNGELVGGLDIIKVKEMSCIISMLLIGAERVWGFNGHIRTTIKQTIFS